MNTAVPKKETLFKTAWSHTFQCYVGITHAHQDSRGEWIFTCDFTDGFDGSKRRGFLFRTEELDNFVL